MDPYPDISPVLERRLKPRIICDCAALIRGQDGNGKNFEEGGRVINLSRSGMYVLLNREIPNGTALWVKMALPTAFLRPESSRLAVYGTVVRGEVRSASIYGIGISFAKYRFV